MLKVAAVSFVNAWPLVRGLKNNSSIELLEAPPAECASLFWHKKLDLALLPLAELAIRQDICVFPDYGICSATEVKSVKVFSRCPLEKIKLIKPDPNSRTSNQLARILVREISSNEAIFTSEEDYDACILIGDPAFRSHTENLGFSFVYDLAAEWFKQFNLPFVFALWAGRETWISDKEVTGDTDLFGRSFSPRGLEVRDLIKKQTEQQLATIDSLFPLAAERLQCTKQEASDYLQTNLHYRMTDLEHESIRLFLSLLK